jgi:hypothetical protein
VRIGQSKGKSMTRNLKALGLALVAVFATTAVLASAAQAQIKVTTGISPAWLTGEQVITAPHHFTVENGGPKVACQTADFAATVNSGDTSVTVVPKYEKCHAIIGTETFKVTVTMNDCDYLFHGGVEVSSTTFKEGEIDLVCPVAKEVEVHIYKKPTEEIEELCTLKVAPFTNNKAPLGNEFHNEGTGSTNDLTVTTNLTFNITRTGSLLCGKTPNTAVYTGSTTLKAFEHKGGTIFNGTVASLVEGNQVSLTASK